MNQKTSRLRLLLGAAFLMATSAIGPGFLTQTTHFTERLLAAFGFVILVSILIDIIAQLNIWRIIAVSGKRAQQIANDVFFGLGHFLAALVVAGGLSFNIGNVAGAGLGLNVLLGISPKTGALLSGLLAIGIFVFKEAGKAMDIFAQAMGFVMIVLTIYVMIKSTPPYGQAVVETFVPETVDILAIITIVGGTVGGYITFAGGHRLLDAGVQGKSSLPEVTKSAVSAIGIASLMRVLLFLATLGVVTQSFSLDPSNPPASVFQHAAGAVGYKIFGIVMWAAAVTSVVGAAYTSVSFIRTFHSMLSRYHQWLTIGFIALSTFVFVLVGEPVKVLILVGSLNGLILPISLGVMLIAAYRKKVVGDYRHPLSLTILGGIVVVAMAFMGVYSLFHGIPRLFE